MAATDNPLKRLFNAFTKEMAAWLLNAEVQTVSTVSVEISARNLSVDQVREVILADQSSILLHVEFQGRSSKKPMPWRMLEYMSLITDLYRKDMHNVVVYVGKGAGSKDTGQHHIRGPLGEPVLSWSYQVIHLWKMNAEELLSLGRADLLPLLGQTQVDKPEIVFPEAIKTIKAQSANPKASLDFLLTLITDEEVGKMVSDLVEEDELMNQLIEESPYLNRAFREGFAEGEAKKQADIKLEAKKEFIMDALVTRFSPSITAYRDLEKKIRVLHDENLLKEVFNQVLQAESVDVFQKWLLEHLSAN